MPEEMPQAPAATEADAGAQTEPVEDAGAVLPDEMPAP
jgi:hypothetical protein